MKLIFNFNKRIPRVLLVVLVFIIYLFIISAAIVYAIAPNPGHSWTELECTDKLCVDTASGRVGIGTASPTQPLDVRADSASAKYIWMKNYAAGGSAGIKLDAVDGSWTSTITQYQGTGLVINAIYDTVFQSSGNNKMIIKGDTGNVGIGTADPGSNKLRVSGGNVRFDGTSGGTIGFEQQNGFHRIVFDQLRFWDWEGGGDMVTFQDGNVGIGTTTLNAKLDVKGNIHATQDICTDINGKCLSNAGGGGYWQQGTSGIYYDNGNVGIGIGSAPGEKLDVGGKIRAQGSGGNTVLWHGAANGVVGTTSNTPLALITDDQNRIFITNTGNIGIGTTYPQGRLEVTGGDTKLAGSLYLKDYDGQGDGTPSSIARDGNWMFFDGGVVIGRYGDGEAGNIGAGNLRVKDNVIVDGKLILPTDSCVLRRKAFSDTFGSVGCLNGEMVISGGGNCAPGTLRKSGPMASDEGKEPTTWEAVCSANGLNAAYAVCCKFK